MPKAATEKDQPEIHKGQEVATPVPPNRDVKIISELARQDHVPAPPDRRPKTMPLNTMRQLVTNDYLGDGYVQFACLSGHGRIALEAVIKNDKRRERAHYTRLRRDAICAWHRKRLLAKSL